ncbi:hypothetical protein MCP1_110068 [Candidatus Terasakiella magnetica]|nr:hypothetical protein MCP1_110068 [Candidatus Terasakiella magnetica]
MFHTTVTVEFRMRGEINALDGEKPGALSLFRGDLSDRIAATVNKQLKRFARSLIRALTP